VNLTQADKRWIEEFRRQLREQFPGVKAEVLIYGSKARGEANPDSDLDVLLIVPDEQAHRKKELRCLGYSLDPFGDVAPSIIAYTAGEWAKRLKSGSPFREAVDRDKVRVL